MVVDTSALLAIALDELECQAFLDAIERDPTRLISAASVLEGGIIVESRLGPDAGDDLDQLMLVTVFNPASALRYQPSAAAGLPANWMTRARLFQVPAALTKSPNDSLMCAASR